MIVFGEAHLRRILGKYAAHYESRIHRSLNKDDPFYRAIERGRCHIKRRIKTQTVLPSADTAAMLFWALLVSVSQGWWLADPRHKTRRSTD
jgi:transposase-like protein